MTNHQRGPMLLAIAVVVAAVGLATYGAGVALGSSLVRFAGMMVGATTFVPLPADTFVLAASAHDPAVVLGVVGGVINGLMVLVERSWLRLLMEYSWFDRFNNFFETNRFVAWTERNMFLALVVGGASFIPFEPFRLIAVVSDYPRGRYFVATALARGGRYWALAALGSALLEIGFLQQAIWITFALFLVGLWRSGRRLIDARRP